MRVAAIGSCAALVLLCGCALPLGSSFVSDSDYRLAATHRDRGSLKLNEGALALAIREYEKSIEINPYDPESHFGLGEALRKRGMLDESEAAFREALKLEPDLLDARLNLVVLALQRERWQRAVELSSELMQEPSFLNPSRALVNRGWAYYKLGDVARAESDFREALEIDSSLYQAHLNLGIVLYEREDVVGSLTAFERVLEILENYRGGAQRSVEAETRFRIAQARVRLGQREQALVELRAAADRGGSGNWGERAREYLSVLE